VKSNLLEFDVDGGYRIQPIPLTQYLKACQRLEKHIFGNYFEFRKHTNQTDAQHRQLKRFQRASGELYEVLLGIYHDHDIIGWHYSAQRNSDEIVMRDTGILPAHQRKGIYSSLLPRLLKHFETAGLTNVVSYHRATNNAVIIPKLKAGFMINGLTVDQYGLAVELIYTFDEDYRNALRVRSGEIRPTGPLAEMMGLAKSPQ
jgi:L-amino acid N-acyltransferase YncA